MASFLFLPDVFTTLPACGSRGIPCTRAFLTSSLPPTRRQSAWFCRECVSIISWMAVASQSTCRQSQLRRDCMVCAESAGDKTCRIRVNLVPADYKRRGKMKHFISHSRWLQCFCFIQRLASLRSHRRDIGCGLNSLMASLLMSRQSEERPAAGSCVWKRGGGSRSSHYEIRQTVFSSSSDVIAPALLFE